MTTTDYGLESGSSNIHTSQISMSQSYRSAYGDLQYCMMTPNRSSQYVIALEMFCHDHKH
jgi:hypothetical protein